MTTTKEVAKWADRSMYTAEPSESEKGVRAALVSCDPDPLGVVAIGGIAYTGRTIRNTVDVTDEERRYFIGEIAKTALKAPLEFVRFVFVIEGVHRGVTHQMVRQRTAVYVQESQRFAVKEDAGKAVALPPSLRSTDSLRAMHRRDSEYRDSLGLQAQSEEDLRTTILEKGGADAWRVLWDEQVAHMAGTYRDLVDRGMPAEDARGLLPTNILTKIQYSTTLRGFYDTLAMRVSDQAQFEWRELVTAMVLGMRDYGNSHWYKHWESKDSYVLDPSHEDRIVDEEADRILVESSSFWQMRELSYQIKPLDFVLGRRAFGAAFDRASRIGERVDAYAACGVPSSEWINGSRENNIPPIHPDEWLLDPASARLAHDEEFDIFGNRVRVGTGAHWDKGLRKIFAASGEEVKTSSNWSRL
jgi:flavin-dependent thymidylate synthase